MKIIFLDIDGVLNTEKHIRYLLHNDLPTQDNDWCDFFDPKCIVKLKKIIDQTGAKIVISSTWRFMGLDKLRKKFEERGILGEIIDRTSLSRFMRERGYEIQTWLDNHDDVESYAILDDDVDMLPSQLKNLVVTSWKNGISNKNVKDAIKILNDKRNIET